MSRLKAARATERMREMVGENGPCSELSTCLVPLPLKPEVLLEGLLPQVGVCVCCREGGWGVCFLGGEVGQVAGNEGEGEADVPDQ